MRILFIGDIVGRPGYRMVQHGVPHLRKQFNLDLVIANGENAADGSGLTPKLYKKIVDAEVDAITLGDHIYRRREIYEVLDHKDNIVKPANFPSTAPGKTHCVVSSITGRQVAVISVIGRVFMKPVDCPFAAIDRELKRIPQEIKTVFVDFHAEATSDKQVMGRYLDGRVSAVLGTHTHVATADEQILPGGTAFQCDVGMTGPHESILGRDIKAVTDAATTFRPIPFKVAINDVRLNGSIVEVDPSTGRATSIERLCYHWENLPDVMSQ